MESAPETSSSAVRVAETDVLLGHLHVMTEIARTNAANNPAMSSWRYCSFAELLLHRGRLFTPSTASVAPARPRDCFRNAALLARDSDAVYVEGVALTRSLVLSHAWCARGSQALDPTWPDGQAYLGLPLRSEFCSSRPRSRADGSLLSLPENGDLLRDGLPDDALADIGHELSDAREISSGHGGQSNSGLALSAVPSLESVGSLHLPDSLGALRELRGSVLFLRDPGVPGLPVAEMEAGGRWVFAFTSLEQLVAHGEGNGCPAPGRWLEIPAAELYEVMLPLDVGLVVRDGNRELLAPASQIAALVTRNR